ncbi:hypothetical protein [Mycobacteroides abscessus]|uniref:hypothetical protein n=1 Tax=Mycobacteroides abscessus TaxID=36809 RepID=UPI000D99BB16|nr:hypothetical protein [Mycobacteroides abscessus]SPX87637.1 Uncharacterised protein [Mycobacteroides abscessus]
MSVYQLKMQVEKPSQSIIYVDPAMARRVLAKNTRNRPISETHVKRLMDEMRSGRWQYNGEGIKWSVDDVLLDGQHRLTALSRMPDDFPALPFLVVRGLPTASQDTMDQGRTRSAGDQRAAEYAQSAENRESSSEDLARVTPTGMPFLLELVQGEFGGGA